MNKKELRSILDVANDVAHTAVAENHRLSFREVEEMFDVTFIAFLEREIGHLTISEIHRILQESK